MFGTRLSDGATFSCEVDFRAGDYANISFFDASRADIPLHLSLRRLHGQIGHDRLADGAWLGAQHAGADFRPQRNRLALTFTQGAVHVMLNGQPVAFPDLVPADPAGLVGFDLQGAFVAGSFRLDGPGLDLVPGRGAVALVGPFTLAGWAIDPLLDTQHPELRVAGDPGIAAVEPCALPEVAAEQGLGNPWIGFRAVLPGRIWRNVAPDAPVLLQPASNGRACGEALALTRADILAQIEALLPGLDWQGDALQALLVVEHVRFAGLWPRLSPDAAETLRRIAGFYRVTDFLWPEDSADTGTAAAPPLPETDAEAQAMAEAEAARALFATRLRAHEAEGTPAPDLAEVLDSLPPLAPPARQLLLLWLAEVFCGADRFADLYSRALQDGLADFEPGPHAWRNSAILPFLFAAGRITEVARILTELAPPQEGWRSAPALAWLMRRVAQGGDGAPRLSDADRAALLPPLCDFLVNRAGDYWDLVPNAQLAGASAALARRLDHLPEDLARKVQAALLQAHGLSAEFWQALQGAALPPGLAAAGRAFAAIRDHLEGRRFQAEAVQEALAFFATAGLPDLPRLRREVLAPAGLAPGAALPQILRAGATAAETGPDAGSKPGANSGSDPGDEMLLRHLAFPGLPEPAGPEAEALAALAQPAVRRAYAIVPRAPFFALQQQMGQDLAALLARPGAEMAARADAALPGLLAGCDTLCQPSSRYLGFGLAVSLADGLLKAEALQAAGRVADHLAALRSGLDPEAAARLHWAPALQSALFTLRQTAQALPDGPARAQAEDILALFPASVDLLPRAFTGTALVPPGPGLHGDTIVVVMSCRPNLETRIPALRSAWLETLAHHGIPHVVVVGGSADGPRLEGNVLHLEAPDDYEGLPQKTLAAIAWVHDNTAFAHMVKVDDDCFVEPGAFFGGLSQRKFHFYGRLLIRRPGQMDRGWHCEKSTSDRGRYELDRSPEPSVYADGGSGYVLNRIGMAIALHRAHTPEGRALIRHSLMEDKLLGDLLALARIGPEEEEYHTAVRRRSHGAAHPVPLWVNGFLPNRAAGTKLVHLDRAADQAPTAAGLGGLRLRPGKIWPSHLAPRLGYNTNLLELQSPEDKLTRLNRAPVAVVAAMRNEMFMLPHFLAHYRRLGVTAFLIADNCSDDGTLEHLLAQPDVATFSVDSDYRISHYGVAWQQAILSHFRQGRWSLVADADELLLAEPAHGQGAGQGGGGRRLETILAGADFAGADAVRVRMLDMYPQGPLSAVDFASGDPFAEAGFVERDPFLTSWPGLGHYGNGPTWTSALRHRLIPGSRSELFVAQKIALVKYRPWMRFSAGLHYAAGVQLAPREMLFAHFKYHAEFRRKAETEVRRRQHFNDAEEYARYLAVMIEGRDVIFDPAHSLRWEDCATVQRLIGA